MIAANDKRLITVVFCGTATGDFLPVQVIYKGKTQRCHAHLSFPPGWHLAHSANHWSTEETMLQYVDQIILPYVGKTRELFGDDTSALVIMDNFKGQITESLFSLLDRHNILVCLLPPNTTDRLQPMDISVNKPAKDHLKQQFSQWFSEQVLTQLGEVGDMEELEIQPIDISMSAMKEVSAKWLVSAVNYIRDNPGIIVNGFIRSGIMGALDGEESENSSVVDDQESTQEFDSDGFEHVEDV